MFDLRHLSPAFYADPYPTYRRLQTGDPVLELPDGGVLLTRYDDVRTVYRDAARFSSDKRIQFEPMFGAGSPLFEHHTTSLVFNDPPLHTHVRKAIGNALSARVVSALRGDLETLVEGLLDELERRGEIDAIAGFASAIPVEIIGNLLGVPRAERDPLRAWSLAILGSLEVALTAAQKAHGERCVDEFLAYLDELVARRRKAPATDDDILARLMSWEEDGRALSAKELYHQCVFLLNAGHETTTNLIGNGIELLLRYPTALEQLRDNPTLIGPAVEEMLRYESPNQLGNRTTTQATEIGGRLIPPDTVLTLCIGAANRDPEVFSHPDTFDLTRASNPHLAFGAGIHTCAGLNVARLEAQVAITRFFSRFSDVTLRDTPARAPRARFRGWETLPLTVRR